MAKGSVIEFDLIHVTWADACGGMRVGWRDIEDMTDADPVECHSVGWMIERDKDRIILCPHLTEDGQGDGEIVIPAPWVVKLTTLKKRG